MQKDLAFWLKKLDLAEKLAEVAHAPQTRWDGTPYIEHPRAVAERAFRCAVDGCVTDRECVRIKIIGLLHDVVEDTPIPPKLIADVFETDVAKAVMILTRPNAGDMGREMEQYLYETQLVQGGFREIIVKLADVWHNASTPAADHRRATAWCLSAYRTLQIVRRWMEARGSGSMSIELIKQVERLYGDAHDAVDLLFAGGNRQKADLIQQVRKIEKNVTVVPE